ncbi:hypothetical protein [Salipiger aestuarii]|uniref:hypothetical protein n=1 Tax=Salipiger aestuarii TaxID=568098 RepID=UPI0012391BA0|nr:hypothetical protein [Salipiger aestuarii]KAA8610837.1 hypothetical protein AL037_11580 [Salipiger aestuarii]
MGTPLRFDDVKAMKKSAYTSNRDGDPFAAAGGAVDDDRPPLAMTPKGRSLNDWHSQYKDRFEMANLLEDMCSDKIRRAGNEASGHVHIECPFEHEHSAEGGTATMAVNASDSQQGYWTVFCRHDACQNRHKLQFLEEMLRAGWFDEELLFDPEEGYILDAADEEDQLAELADQTKTPEERAALINKATTEAEISAFIRQLTSEGVDKTVQGNVTALIATKTSLSKPDVKRMWKAAAQDKKRAHSGAPAIILSEGFRANCDKAAQVMAAQADNPTLFHSNARIVEAQENENGDLKIETVGRDRFKARMEGRLDFFAEERSVGASVDLVNNVFHRDKTAYPPLHKIIRAPIFAPDKALILTPGYHPSGVLYQPLSGVEVARVSAKPTPEDVRDAVEKLTDLLADFPFDAMTREELVAAVRAGDPVPSFCHALSAGLTAICRPFIVGPTPGHLARKMNPRTGATKLLTNVSYIATLAYARGQSLPDSKAEVQKTVVASLDTGMPYIFFDNLPDSGKVDFGELASAMTAWPYYTGRRLGQTDMVDAKVDTTWLFTGNRTALSDELAQRMLLIVLDPQMERPEERTGFKYNIDGHVAANGGEYLHALLTIVQHWIAVGCPDWSGRPLGGFERHSAIIDGILETAGVTGFLGNRELLRSHGAASPEDDLMDALIERDGGTPPSKDGTLFRVWGADAPPQRDGTGAPNQFAKCRVLSIKDALEAESIALKGAGYAQTESGSVLYPDRAKSALAQRIAGLVGIVREKRDDGLTGRFIFERAGKDKHSVLYKLKRLDLVS